MVDPAVAFHLCCTLPGGAWHRAPVSARRPGAYVLTTSHRGYHPATHLNLYYTLMTTKKAAQQTQKKVTAEKRELAMIEGILEGSPEGIGVVVVRLDCGCRKMAAVDKQGDPASKIIMYRDMAESICAVCKEDNGSFMRVTESFIHWVEPEPTVEEQQAISAKVLGSAPSH